MSEQQWVVTAFDFGKTDVHECALVSAATEQEAAQIGAELLQRWNVRMVGVGLTVEHVFVGPWPRVAYTAQRRFDATVAEWQCCGGPDESGGHYGGCPTLRND